MALTNAEKQARWRERLKERSAQCVTPDDVIRAARLLHEQDQNDFTFEEWVEVCSKDRNGDDWLQSLPDQIAAEDLKDFNKADGELLQRVAKVVAAVKHPPTL